MAGSKSKQSGSVQLSIGNVLPGRTKSGALSKRPRKAGAGVRVAVDGKGNIETDTKRVIGSEAARLVREKRAAGGSRNARRAGTVSANTKKAARRLAEMRLLRSARKSSVNFVNPQGATGGLANDKSTVTLRETKMTAAQKRGKNKVNPDYREQRSAAGNALRAQANKRTAKKRVSAKRAAAKKTARG